MTDTSERGVAKSLRNFLDTATKQFKKDADGKVQGSKLVSVVATIGLILLLSWELIEKVVTAIVDKLNDAWMGVLSQIVPKDHWILGVLDLWVLIALVVIFIFGARLWKNALKEVSESIKTPIGQFLFRSIVFGIIGFAIWHYWDSISGFYNEAGWRTVLIILLWSLIPLVSGIWFLYNGSEVLPGEPKKVAGGAFYIALAGTFLIAWSAALSEGESREVNIIKGWYEKTLNAVDPEEIDKRKKARVATGKIALAKSVATIKRQEQGMLIITAKPGVWTEFTSPRGKSVNIRPNGKIMYFRPDGRKVHDSPGKIITLPPTPSGVYRLKSEEKYAVEVIVLFV